MKRIVHQHVFIGDMIAKARDAGKKITRDAFLYMNGDADDFAQCGSCAMFDLDDGRCLLFGPDDAVSAGGSCGLYTQQNDDDRLSDLIAPMAVVTPDEAGYVERPVRCENCRYGGKTCGLYEQLNAALPDVFDLDVAIEPQACCNAQTPA